MTERTAGGRPALGELKPGQAVMVQPSMNDRRSGFLTYIPATVVKVGRVWIELERVNREGFPLAWRMRRNTQDEGSKYSGNNASFATLEQHSWDETRNWAFQTLAENGIRLDSGSIWSGREIELADLISKAESERITSEHGHDPGPTVIGPNGWPVPDPKLTRP